MKQYSFVKFTGNYTRGDSKIAINKSGLIRFSPKFCKAADAVNFKYAVLFFDNTNKIIAFKFTNTKEEGRLTLTKDRTAATISAKTFVKVNNLNLRSYFRRYDWEKITLPDIGQVYIIKLIE